MIRGFDRVATSAGTLILVDSAPRSTSGNSGANTSLGGVTALRAELHVTEVSGVEPKLTVVVEETLDGTNWHQIGNFTERRGVGRQTISLGDPLAETIRLSWTITGTAPLFTFSVTSPPCWSDA